MYVDDAVVAGILIVVVTAVITIYIGRFMYKHVQDDVKKSGK